MNKSPAFQFYPDKALAGTQHLSPEAFKAYWLMLCWMWLHSPDQCSIPDDPGAWAIAMQLPTDNAKKCMQEIQNKHMSLLYASRKKLYSLGLKKEAEKQRKNREQKKSAANYRWNKEKRKMHTHSTRIDSASIPQCEPASVPQCSTTPTPTPTPLKKKKQKENLSLSFEHEIPGSVSGVESDFSKSQKPITELYQKTRRDYKLPEVIDANGKQGVRLLAQMVDSGEITMPELEVSMRSFCKKVKKGGDFENWGLHGFAKNVSMFPPDKPTPVMGATGKPPEPEPDTPEDRESLRAEMKAILADENSSPFMRERAEKYFGGEGER